MVNNSITQFDREYCELLKKILKEGKICKNRTGVDTLSIEGVNFKLDISKEFPILESKKVFAQHALSEILWIFQAQSNQVKWLQERNNNIWNEWKIDEDGIYRIYVPNDTNPDPEKMVEVVDLDGNIIKDKYNNVFKAKSKYDNKTIKSAKYFGKEYAGTIGTAYGWINNKFKRPQYVLNELKNNPNNRRLIISLWQDEYLKTAVLPSCVWSSEYKVSEGKLNAYIHQRSADTPLGLPFNVSQYAFLLSLFAKASGLEAGNLNYSIMDAHIYVDQIEGIKRQLKRYELMKKNEEIIKNHLSVDNNIENLKYYKNLLLREKSYLEYKIDRTKELEDLMQDIEILEFMMYKEKPELVITDNDDFFKFDNNVNNDKEYLKQNATGNKDIKLLKYKSLSYIKMPVSQ